MDPCAPWQEGLAAWRCFAPLGFSRSSNQDVDYFSLSFLLGAKPTLVLSQVQEMPGTRVHVCMYLLLWAGFSFFLVHIVCTICTIPPMIHTLRVLTSTDHITTVFSILGDALQALSWELLLKKKRIITPQRVLAKLRFLLLRRSLNAVSVWMDSQSIVSLHMYVCAAENPQGYHPDRSDSGG